MRKRKEEPEEYTGKDLPAEPGDENDPAYKEEMFETSKACGRKPEDYLDKGYAAGYRAWLEVHKDDPK